MTIGSDSPTCPDDALVSDVVNLPNTGLDNWIEAGRVFDSCGAAVSPLGLDTLKPNPTSASIALTIRHILPIACPGADGRKFETLSG